jgi:hypothetical protein
MTSTETEENRTGPITVELKHDFSQKPFALVRSSKHANTFLVSRDIDGTAFYRITMQGPGNLHKSISGKFSTIERALDALSKFVESTEKTQGKRREETVERIRGAELRSKSD